MQTGTAAGLRAGPSCRTIPGTQSMSVQLFQSVIFNHEVGNRRFPRMERIERISMTLEFTPAQAIWATRFCRIYFSLTIRRAITRSIQLSYAPPGMKTSALLFYFDGADLQRPHKFNSFGFFDEKDSGFFKMRYQS